MADVKEKKYMSSNIPDNEPWRIFFDVYRTMPELWDEKCTFYKSKNRRRKASEKLLEIYKMICKNADHNSLWKRLANIRKVYRRELKRVQESKGTDDEYVPILWYYELCKSMWDPDPKDETHEGSDHESVAVECCLKEFDEGEDSENVAKTSNETSKIPPADLVYEESRKKLRAYLDNLLKRNAEIVEGPVKRMKNEDQESSSTTQPSYMVLRKIVPSKDQNGKKKTSAQDKDLITTPNGDYSVTIQPQPVLNNPGFVLNPTSGGICSYPQQSQYILRQILPKQADVKPTLNLQECPMNPPNQNFGLPTQPYIILRQVPPNKDQENPTTGEQKPQDPTTVNQDQPGKPEEQPVKDEASAYAESWAMSFRQLSPMQKIYAKKAIEDILVLGQLECLSLNTVDTITASGNAPDP